jgi:C1A family cysteine protease
MSSDLSPFWNLLFYSMPPVATYNLLDIFSCPLYTSSPSHWGSKTDNFQESEVNPMASPASKLAGAPVLSNLAPIPEPETRLGMGWLPDYPDFRDLHIASVEVPSRINQISERHRKSPVSDLLARVGVTTPPATLPATVDLRSWCSPVENQGALGSCTANAGVGAVEYFERRAFGRHLDASRLFLYKTTRNLMHWTGDTGAFLRSTMGALALFGVPPEEHHPYDVGSFDQEPSAFCYAFAQNYQAIQYYRLDPPGMPPNALLYRIKTNLAAGLPSIFGFTVYSSYTQAANNGGMFPFPSPGERIVGGHALMAVGFDDNKKVTNANDGGPETTGALLIRNSWGTGWGSNGYGYLPYQYVQSSLAEDWWSLIKLEWVDTGKFGLPA